MKFGEKLFFENENDEVINFKNKEIEINENYKYLQTNPFVNFFSFLTYKFILIPFAFFTFKVIKIKSF